jgi:succinate dehydrogenase / fumarate reductase, cytochrome b subunit
MSAPCCWPGGCWRRRQVPGAYAAFQSAAASFIGRIVLFGYTWALIHHMLGGMRYLIWDTGRGFGADEREWLVRANLVGSITLTIILWVVGGYLMGGNAVRRIMP